jgi:NifB/MoaA-like Fe-S oxidoreductase
MKRLIGPLLIAAFAVVVWQVLFAGNPGGISDERYSRYTSLRSPKLLYSCTRPPTPERLLQLERTCRDKGRSGCELEIAGSPEAQPQSEIEFAGSDGNTSYAELLEHARHNCAAPRGDLAPGKFEILEADKR